MDAAAVIATPRLLTELRVTSTMPTMDLTDGPGRLHPLAPFKVTAVMCHPSDRKAQHRMVALLEAETGEGPAKRPRLKTEEFELQFEKAGYTGGRISGALLMNLVQLDRLGHSASVNKAFELLRYVLPDWEQPSCADWPAQAEVLRTPRNRKAVLAIFKAFLPASHLWAATMYGIAEDRNEISPSRNSTIPTFIGYANAFANMASRVKLHARDRRYVLPANVPWRFKLPESLIVTPELAALPLHEEQQNVIRKFRH